MSTEQIIPTKKKLKMAKLYFLRADRADIDAYRTQSFNGRYSQNANNYRMGSFKFH